MRDVDWIEANGAWLRFAVEGRGERTVVLVHEMGGTLESWNEIVPILKQDYRVVRYDMRGFGLSQKIFGDHRLQDPVDDLLSVIDAVGGAGPVALVGCAVGAGVAMVAAAQRPERVAALVALAPATEVPQERRASAQAFLDALPANGMRHAIEAIAPTGFPPALRSDEQRFKRFLAIQSSTDLESFMATYNLLLESDYKAYLPKISCPSLVVAGILDQARPPAHVERVARAIPGARFEVVESGHYMNVQSPELVGPMIARFLTQTGFGAPTASTNDADL